ncbi:MAG TPA: dUTP diphosphatase [Tepidiformaceae bacterium]|nr:dUTP diphosphatase [Tepidiformaceae bacterium]
MSEAMQVGFRKLRDGARVPARATESASGFDLYACLPDGDVEVGPSPVVVGTGIALEIPPGIDAQIRPRSGLSRQGVMGTLGTIDSDYRGELMVTLYRVGTVERYVVKDGDRIAQLVFGRLAPVEFAEQVELSETGRGAAGHGSTGR